jgi:PAS domain S-box-containing protein
MRIKNQFRVSIIIFLVLLALIAASILFTQQQAVQLNNQEVVALDVQTRVSNLAYISNDYFLFQESSGLSQWQIEFSSLTSDLSKINVSSPEQQSILNNTKDDAQRLSGRWNDVVSYLESAPRNVSIRVLPEFQTRSSRMSLQNQAVIFDAQQLSQTLRNQIDQLNTTRVILVLTILGLFGAYLVTNYLVTYRNTLNSISELQAGIAVIGSGKLDYSLKADRKDEVGEIARSVNQMAANLKNVTASKSELEQAQTSLRESEQRWATTLASIGDAVIATNLSGKVTFMNGVAEELTGWKLSEAALKPVKEIFNIVNEQTRIMVENPVSKVLEKGLIVGLANHTVLIRKNKTEVAIDDSGAPIKDKEGKTTGVVLIFRDITERKKVEESLERQAALIDLSPDAIIVKDLGDNIRFWSNGAEKLYGFTRAEAINRKASILLRSKGPEHLDEIINHLEREGRWSGEVIHKTKAGQEVIVQSWWLMKINENGPSEIFESNVDITERRVLQEKLEESSVRVEEYATQMEELANQRLEQLKNAERLAAIGATAGMVGHDIRNPLQAITGDIYLAKTDLASTPESEEKKNIQESLDEIENNVSYINKIVADLQDYARPLSPKLEEIDLEKTVHSVLANINIPGNVTVKHSIRKDLPKLKLDQSYIQRILTNLSNNAIQAMPKGGKLTINAITKNGKVIISVEDTGEGIPESFRNKLFMPLATTKSKGQGFGLSVVKRFTERLGGTVTFESEVGKGTKFIIELPL